VRTEVSLKRPRLILSSALRKWIHKDPLTLLKARGLVVGQNFHMLQDVAIDWSHCWHIRIGDDVTLARGVIILAHDASTKGSLGYTRIGKVDIGDRVFVGAASLILPGVRVGNDVVIGAGSVVTHDVADGTVVAGNPARVIATRDEWVARKRHELESSVIFGHEYTVGGGVTDSMKDEMNAGMVDRIGYIV